VRKCSHHWNHIIELPSIRFQHKSIDYTNEGCAESCSRSEYEYAATGPSWLRPLPLSQYMIARSRHQWAKPAPRPTGAVLGSSKRLACSNVCLLQLPQAARTYVPHPLPAVHDWGVDLHAYQRKISSILL